MQKKSLITRESSGAGESLSLHMVHTLVIGSGAAGLNAAVQLHAQGIEDVLIVTEGFDKGTSINTGSDKQTYYKLSMCGSEDDSPEALAESFYAGGSMHGDLALVEASLSARAFLHLVNLGVPFPRDRFGQFVGYKTDHDPRQRATSVGPYTSREMCTVLIREVRRREIPVHENRVVVSLLCLGEGDERRIAGALAVNLEKNLGATADWHTAFELYAAENVVFATGGPGGLYKTSVYPKVHTGGIGLALMVGAKAQSLPESQFGLASIKFRWNVSGSYMQAIPRFFSTEPDGRSHEEEFLRPYFDSLAEMNSAIFLKGYQWPFDVTKIVGGSSIVDVLVYIETVVKKRRVFLDYRRNSDGFDFKNLRPEAREYLSKSKAMANTPIERLKLMNPAAVNLYMEHNFDITVEPLEIAVCAQHNNGGLASNVWWESTNIKHLFPVGEVNGSHGVSRPGGSALNSGQVGGFRAAEYIANRYRGSTLDMDLFNEVARRSVTELWDWIAKGDGSPLTWEGEREEFQSRMTQVGSHIRSLSELRKAVPKAWEQWERLKRQRSRFSNLADLSEGLRNLQLCFAHAVYLEAVLFAVESGVGSRGSAMVLDKDGVLPHKSLGDEWRFAPEYPPFRKMVLETVANPDGTVKSRWVNRRPVPHTDAWFETEWRAFRDGEIYNPQG
jgi:succinate dehydrogenase/fumarate reductase flavoprotein subunit